MSLSIPLPREGDAVRGLSGFRHCYAEVNGTRLHYVVGGSGPPLVLLHGWPFTWAEWTRLMPLLSAGGRTVIAPDLRGFGQSEKPVGGYEKSNVAEDIHALVRLRGYDTIDLMGVDIGMMVAFAYAVAHRSEVRHLILGESLLPGFGLEELMNPATSGYWHFGFHMQVDLATMLTEGREEAYLMPMWQATSTSPNAEAVARERYLPHFLAPEAMRGGFAHYGTLLDDGRENREQLNSPLDMPVLVLNGERGIPQDQTLGNVIRIATNVQSDIVPGASHAIAEDNPEWIATRLAAFLSS